MGSVKRPNKQAERSRLTRQKIVTAAHELFLANGYEATNLKDVAEHAGVAVQTIYFVFRNKRTLFKEVVDTAIAGDDEPVATMERAWFRDACAAPTATELLKVLVRGSRKVLGRVAPMTPLIESASASDPEIAALWPSEKDPRYTVLRAAAEALVSKPGARSGMSAETAADKLFGLLSPQLYLIFVHERSWPPLDWENWVYETLRSQLCAPPSYPEG